MATTGPISTRSVDSRSLIRKMMRLNGAAQSNMTGRSSMIAMYLAIAYNSYRMTPLAGLITWLKMSVTSRTNQWLMATHMENQLTCSSMRERLRVISVKWCSKLLTQLQSRSKKSTIVGSNTQCPIGSKTWFRRTTSSWWLTDKSSTISSLCLQNSLWSTFQANSQWLSTDTASTTCNISTRWTLFLWRLDTKSALTSWLATKIIRYYPILPAIWAQFSMPLRHTLASYVVGIRLLSCRNGLRQFCLRTRA